MKKEVWYYKKCMLCGKVMAYLMRAEDANTTITDKDIYMMIASSCEPQNRIRTEWCEDCNMHTKQEEVGWDYLENEKANVPDDMMRTLPDE